MGWEAKQRSAIIAVTNNTMRPPILLIHHGAFQPLWQQPGLIQVGPQISDGPESLRLSELSATGLRKALQRRGWVSANAQVRASWPAAISITAPIQSEPSRNTAPLNHTMLCCSPSIQRCYRSCNSACRCRCAA